MRDRRDYVIAALAAALLFCLGVFVGGGDSLLPSAAAQGGGAPAEGNNGSANSGGDTSTTNKPPKTFDPTGAIGVPGSPSNPSTSNGGGLNLGGGQTRTSTRISDAIYSDSNSNNRFIAVTAPIGSGESVLFLFDSKREQLAIYRYIRRKGMEFLAARRIDYDLRVTGYEDISKYSRDQMKRIYEKSLARAAAEAAKAAKKKK